MSKHLVDWSWYSNGKKVYYRLATELKKADGRTFEPLNHIWARDKDHVFVLSTMLRSADRATFRVLNELFAKDAHNVFHLEGKLKGADPQTFEAFPADLESLCSFAKDKDHVYFQCYSVGKPCVVRGADPNTFRPLAHNFGMDDSSVFCGTGKLKGADIKHWRMLEAGYSRDQKTVYYFSQPIPEADPETFEVLPVEYFARDRMNYYRYADITTRDEFAAKLRPHYIFAGTVVSAVVIDKQRKPLVGCVVSDTTRDQGVLFEIKCQTMLHAPDAALKEAPKEGKQLPMIQLVHCDTSQWIDKPWIWFFRPLEGRDGTLMAPILTWQQVSPVHHRDRIEALVAELLG